MDLLNTLDIPEILKAGAIGLGFLLALLSFLLLRKEQDKDKPSKVILSSIKLFMIFSLLIMSIGILSEVINKSQTLSLRLGESNLSVSEIETVSANQINLNKYFTSSEHQFAFKKPNNNWSKVKSVSGISGLYKLMDIKSSLLTEETLKQGISNLPIGSLISASDYYYFENPKTKLSVSPTDSVTNNEIEQALKNYSKQITDTNNWHSYDTTNLEEKEDYLNELIEYRRQIIFFDTLEVKESFILYVMPKDSLAPLYRDLKLPALFTSLTSAFRLNSDKLVANENQILIGYETKMNNLVSNGSLINIKVKKWMRFSENDDYFFVIEITFPQQLNTSVERWDELQETLNSFVKLD